MALTLDRSSLRLFGIDLAAVPGYLRDGWAEALRWPALRWLTPDDPVRVLHADGTESVREGVSTRRAASSARARFVAVELPEPTVLRRSLALPRLTEEELRQAVELDVRAASPFPEDEVVWGYDVEGGERLRVSAALTSRALIERQIEALRPRLGDAQPEVWVGGERPFVIPGYGESARLARSRRMRLALVGLLAMTALLLVALAVTPTLQLRERALEATRKNDELVRAVQPQVQMRDELVRLGDQVRLLSKAAEQRHDVVALIDQLTRQLPDDVTLSRLEIAGGGVRIIGQADNAAQLLQSLSANPAFAEVRAPAGITKAPAGSKEGFTIEFRVVSEVKQR
ncbi:MAG: PilN domain-containing protein [Burkholderiales bacterium]|nr:MAG: PilN domain-containing protein [Burkholderiales bacterium]